MSDIPKSKRSKSKLEVIHKAYGVRSRITNELLLSFGYSDTKLEKHIRKTTAYIKDPEQRKDTQEKLMTMQKDFSLWLIENERHDVLQYCKDIVNHLVAANTIFPSYASEFEERRLEMDRAMIACNLLQQELQYLAESLPADKNKYMAIVLEVEDIFKMIKALRQSDNRFLKHLKDATATDNK